MLSKPHWYLGDISIMKDHVALLEYNFLGVSFILSVLKKLHSSLSLFPKTISEM